MTIFNIHARIEEDIIGIFSENIIDREEPAMTVMELFNRLYEKESYHEIPEDRLLVDFTIMLHDIRDLRGWITFENSPNIHFSTVRLTSDGKQIVDASNAFSISPYPLSIDELLSDDSKSLDILNRVNEVTRIGDVIFTNNQVIVLVGQPRIGKTKILNSLHEISDNSLPLITDFQACQANDLNIFLFDFLEQILTEYNAWTRAKNLPSLQIDYQPDTNFINDQGKEIFLETWKSIINRVSDVKPILIMDEISALLDNSPLDNKIFDFLTEFICENKNTVFVLVGTETILQIENQGLHNLINIGVQIHIGTYPKGTSKYILGKLSKYITITNQILEDLLCLCDEHPLILPNIVAKILLQQRKNKIRSVELEDINELIEKTIRELHYGFLSLFDNLSNSERAFLWCLSQKFVIGKAEINITDLLELATQYEIQLDFSKKGARRLVERGWCEYIDSEVIQVNFGIFILWISKEYLGINEVLYE